MKAEIQPKSEGARPRSWGRDDVLRVIELILIAAAAISAVCTFQIGLNEQRERSAYEAWERYREFAAEHPQFIGGKYRFKEDGSAEDSAYGNYVGRILLAAEIILENTEDSEWAETIKYEISPHASFIVNPNFITADSPIYPPICTYSKSVRDVLVQVFAQEQGHNSVKAAAKTCNGGAHDGEEA